MIVSVDVTDPPDGKEVVVGNNDAISPVGEVDVDRTIVPEYWLRLVSLTVEVPFVDGPMVRLAGLLERLKSAFATVAEMVTVWALAPPTPVTLTE